MIALIIIIIYTILIATIVTVSKEVNIVLIKIKRERNCCGICILVGFWH